MKDTRPRLALLAAALVLALLCLAASALAADQSDPSFGQNGVARVPLPPKAALAEAGIWDLAGTPEGKMAAAIAGESYAGYFGAARLNEDGTIDKSFGQEGFTAAYEVPPLEEAHPAAPQFDSKQKTQAQRLAVQADGKVVVVGYLEEESFNHSLSFAPVLTRYGTDGSLDPSFGEGGVVAPKADNEVGAEVLHAVAIAPSGRIIAVGAAAESRYGNSGRDLILAYTPNGKLDRSFGFRGEGFFPNLRISRSHPATTLTAVRVLPSGKILIAGYLFGRLLLARLTAQGKFDSSFGGGDGKVSLKVGEPFQCCGEVASLALQSDGKILLAGEVSGAHRYRLALARFRANGSLDPSFGEGGLAPARATWGISDPRDIAVGGDGRILVVGFRRGAGKGPTFRALRYLPSGKLDRGFGKDGLALLSPGAQSAATAALTQADGRVAVGGVLAEDYESELLLSRYLTSPMG
jgi:uncharacterized delta-60 repeat protein